MPIKKDATGKRWVEMELVLPGAPEQIWAAMCTGAGNSAWFTRAEIEERIGGELRFNFAPGMHSSGLVTAWEPPHRFGYVETEWSPGAPPIATEITITARSGDKCLVRMVHSLFASTDAWDDQMEGFESGWPGFFEVLRLYLKHFAGQPAACFQAMAVTQADQGELWRRMGQEFGLAGADVGDARTVKARPDDVSGVVEIVRQDSKVRAVILRLDKPTPGVAMFGVFNMGSAVSASVCLFLYGPDAAEKSAAQETAWRERLTAFVKN